MQRFAFVFLLTMALFACSKRDEEIPIVADSDFNNVYGGSASDNAYAAAQSIDGAYVLAGYTESVSSVRGKSDAWVLKLDQLGKIIWQKTFGGSAVDGAYSIVSIRDGGYVIAGYTYSTDGDVTGNHGGADAWIVKLDKDGNKQWQKALGGSNDDLACSVIEGSDGGYIIAGQTASTGGDVSNNHGVTDAWVVMLDKNGNIQWQKTFGGTASEGAESVMETSDGGYIVAGWTNSKDGDITGYHIGWGMYLGNMDGWLIRLDKDRNPQWTKAFGGTRNDVINSVTEGLDKSYTIAGYTKSNYDGDVGANHGAEDAWAVNIDREGKIVWQKPFGGSGIDIAYSIAATGDGGYLLAGFTTSSDGDVSGNHGGEDALVVKLDKSGNKQWQRTLGGSSGDAARAVFQRTNGGYVMVGNTRSNDGDVTGQHGTEDAWVVTLKDP